MLYKLSCILTKFLLSKVDGDTREQDVYIYGFELLISTVAGFVSILIISWGLLDVKYGILFSASFVPLRLFAGGYHANTYGRCFVISNLAYLSVLLLHMCLTNIVPGIVWLCLLGMASCYIMRKAPIIHAGQPINEYKQKRSKKIIKKVLFVDAICALGFAIEKKEELSMMVLSICLVSAFMLVADKSNEIEKKGVGA